MRGILMVFVIKNEHYGIKNSLSPLFCKWGASAYPYYPSYFLSPLFSQ
ncbi:hypothetical protein [uncultured Gammaproteobacteria bacterium]|nr:hypothetical protein [uncultured Gammaproteobacteria bacterium]